MTFRVLFVCAANLCRSPMAEHLFAHELANGVPVEATSAGLRALTGHDMDSASAAALRELGVEAGAHVARQLDADLLAAADLVLTATSSHRSDVVGLSPTAFRRTFTLREFVRLGTTFGPLAEVDADALRERVRDIAGQRGVAAAPKPGADDIGDPFAAPWSQVQACAATIHTSVQQTVAALGLPRR